MATHAAALSATNITVTNPTGSELFFVGTSGNFTINVSNTGGDLNDASDISDYTYKIYMDGTAPADEITGSVTAIVGAGQVTFGAIGELGLGTYFVTAERIADGSGLGEGCVSAPEQIDVDDNITTVVITFDPALQVPNTVCDDNGPYNGQLIPDITPVPASDYEFKWWFGTDTTNVAAEFPAGPAITGEIITGVGDIESIINVQDSVYTVRAKYLPTGCIAVKSYNVLPDPPNIELVESSTPQQLCSPFDGVATVTDVVDGGVSVIGVGPGLFDIDADFTYTWYFGLDSLNNNISRVNETTKSLINV